MEMKEDKSHDTDHWVKQEQNHGAVSFGWVGSTKEGWNLHGPLCRLLINSHSEDDSRRIPLVHICVISYLQIMLLCVVLQIRDYSSVLTFSSRWRLPHDILRCSGTASYLITCQHIITISPSWQKHKTYSKYAPSHNYCGRLWWKTICLCFPVS